MSRRHVLLHSARLAAAAGLCLLLAGCATVGRTIHVSPTGNDDALGTRTAPFRSLHRAQAAARVAAQGMKCDVVIDIAPGAYRLDRTLKLTEADSGRNGFRVIYRSAGGLGKARLLGSVPLVGWHEYRDGIWKIDLPKGMTFNTLYENGQRAWKARFPNHEHHPDMPTARGRYLVSVDGSPKSKKGEKTGWLIYRPQDALPVTSGPKLKILLFSEGKCDWFRIPRKALSIDPKARRVTFPGHFSWGVKAGARFFFEDDLALLDAPGEFYVDETAHTLYYKPMGQGHPDTLGIAAPVVRTLIHIQGRSRDHCVENIVLDGLALEETDGFPMPWWTAGYGARDAALVWMRNTAHIEIRDCHLRNSGRNGIMMIGHNIGNLVAGCWIEHMGVNGVTLCNRFPATKAGPNLDRCEHNKVYNCRIDHVGEIHTYAACVNVFNASYNEISHCELHDSVRYAVTVRGNTGQQYGPPVWTTHPRAQGNRIHHLRVYRCGQDGGDMGALHCADLNNPGGGCVNTFEQITVADCKAIPSMHDIAPDGIFLDWPKMAMDQVFRNIHIVRCQGRQLRSNGPDNAASAQTENVSWKPGFREDLMDYEHIGLTDEFPAEYGGRPPVPTPLPAPRNVEAKATAYDTVALTWDAPKCKTQEPITYVVFRGGEQIATTQASSLTDHYLNERTTYRYYVAARSGDFRKLGARSDECQVQTPPDLVPPALTGARPMPDGKRVRVAFDEPIDAASAQTPANYRFDPRLEVKAVKTLTPECVELTVQGLSADASYTLAAANICDASPAHNPIDAATRVALGASKVIVSYPLDRIFADRLCDASGGGGDARLHRGATMDPHAGPFGRAALVLDGKTGYADAPEDLNLGDGDFTIMLWVYRQNSGTILSKGNGFGDPHQWSLGWPKAKVPGSISLRVENHFFATAANAVPLGRWVHVAFVKRGSSCQAYANGEPSGQLHDLSKVGPLVNDRPLRIGRREHEPNPAFFKGKVAGLVLLKYALDPKHIHALAQGKARAAGD